MLYCNTTPGYDFLLYLEQSSHLGHTPLPKARSKPSTTNVGGEMLVDTKNRTQAAVFLTFLDLPTAGDCGLAMAESYQALLEGFQG